MQFSADIVAFISYIWLSFFIVFRLQRCLPSVARQVPLSFLLFNMFFMIILIVGFRNFFSCLVWAVDFGVQITGEGRSLYIRSFCPAMTSLSRYLEEAPFSISISSSVFVLKVCYGHGFFYCFHFMSSLKDKFREFGFAFCVSKVFHMFFKCLFIK